jgi:hypothetical protein
MKLRELAHVRSGDKGDVANISVIAFEPANFARLRAAVTPECVMAHFGPRLRGAVERFELPGLGALNFVLHDALAGGVTRSLALDPHGKCLGYCLLDMEIEP